MKTTPWAEVRKPKKEHIGTMDREGTLTLSPAQMTHLSAMWESNVNRMINPSRSCASDSIQANVWAVLTNASVLATLTDQYGYPRESTDEEYRAHIRGPFPIFTLLQIRDECCHDFFTIGLALGALVRRNLVERIYDVVLNPWWHEGKRYDGVHSDGDYHIKDCAFNDQHGVPEYLVRPAMRTFVGWRAKGARDG